MTDYQALAKEATASDIFKLENEINKLEITIEDLNVLIAVYEESMKRQEQTFVTMTKEAFRTQKKIEDLNVELALYEDRIERQNNIIANQAKEIEQYQST